MNHPLVVRIPEEQKLMLEIIANSKNVSMAQITRTAIRDYVAKARSEKDLFIKLAAIGKSKKIASAPKNLSENYKNYLYGKVVSK